MGKIATSEEAARQKERSERMTIEKRLDETAAEPKAIHDLFNQLLRQPRIPFPPSRRRLDAPKCRGVYIIRSPNLRIFHVGSTPRRKSGLHGRLSDHLAGKSSFVRLHLKGEYLLLRSGCSFQCIEVPDSRTRALLEAYAIGCLCPAHIGLGK